MDRDKVADWLELSALYERADALGESELATMLADLSARRHPLHRRLGRMLAQREGLAASGFLEELPLLFECVPASGNGHHAGERIGGHVLVELLGVGGAAEVWLADRVEGTFRRAVALKLPYQNHWPGSRHTFLERFDLERDILASLDHPNIARLLDAGVADRQPWLSLELVRGEPITVWCDKRRLTIQQRISVFLQVLLAVEHAHAHLAIHRDLKPSNILVAEPGTVRLLDFGIAKLLDPESGRGDVSDLTAQGGNPLTPRYASPEQLSGSTLTTAVDVYGLGLVLHELMTGALPYDLSGKCLREAESIILTTAPEQPSRLKPASHALEARQCDSFNYRALLRPDLDAIVLHCLQKAAADRYSSVEALRLDLQRWLDHKPVHVVLPSISYRAAKFLRRHPRGVIATAGVVCVISSLLAVARWQSAETARETSLAQDARAFVLDVLRDANPESSKDAGAAAGPLLDQSVTRADRLLANQPELHAEVLEQIAEVDQNLDRYANAQSVLERALAIRRGLGQRKKTALVELELAFNFRRLGDDAKATSILTSLDMSMSPELKAHGLELEGWLAWDRGDLPHAKAVWLEALGVAKRAFARDDTRVANILQALVSASMSSRDYASAERYADEEVAITAQSSSGTMTNRIAALSDQAEVTFASGDYAKSVPTTRSALDACVGALGTQAESCFVLRKQLALLLLRIDANGEALKLLPGLNIEAQNESSPARKVQAESVILRVLAANGIAGDKGSALEADLKPTLALELRLTGYAALAEAAVRRSDTQDALRHLDALSSQPGGSPRYFAVRALMIRGLAAHEQGRTADALRLLAEASSGYAAEYGSTHTQTLLCELNSVAPLFASGAASEAHRRIERAVGILRDRLPPDAPLFQSLKKLGDVQRTKKNSESSQLFFFN